MSFSEIQFPPDISYGASGGPMFSTDIVTTFSGHEQRNSNWSAARAKYNIATGVKTESQCQALIAFFRARKGKAMGFRFKDWSDYKAIAQPIGEGDDETDSFQLIKLNTSGGQTAMRDITKPVSASVKVYVDAELQLSGYTINYATGIITFTEPPELEAVITADFEFDVPVRFDTDELSLTVESFNTGSWNSIPLIEVRI
jgi:uncharacterized protein (TIGR02217 family)